MDKRFHSALLTLAFFATVSLFALSAAPALAGDLIKTDEAPTVATIVPGSVTMPLNKAKAPSFYDAELSKKHADFARFARDRVRLINNTHRYAKCRMQIIPQADGTYKARYHVIDENDLAVKVSKSSSKTIPYVAVLKYREIVMEAAGETPEACRLGKFVPVQIIPNRQIFSNKKGAWK